MYGVDIESYTVTIDEPENHLHPSMQRELLPNLFKAFPRVQFIVATHSPFVATSSPQAKVYALVYSDQQRVRSQLLETADLTGTANRTLREILGVPLSVPVWVEQRLLEIIERYRSGPATAERLEELRKELKHSNLQLFLPEAIDRIGGGSAQHP
jgi:predicted ATP-binding protein involved in virulence